MEENNLLHSRDLEIEKRFGKFVRMKRKELKITQSELSQRALGYSNHQQIGAIERGKSGLSSKTMNDILSVLGCDIEFVELARKD